MSDKRRTISCPDGIEGCLVLHQAGEVEHISGHYGPGNDHAPASVTRLIEWIDKECLCTNWIEMPVDKWTELKAEIEKMRKREEIYRGALEKVARCPCHCPCCPDLTSDTPECVGFFGPDRASDALAAGEEVK